MFHFVLNVYGIREKKRFFAHSGLGCIAGDEQLQASRGQSLWMWTCVCVCVYYVWASWSSSSPCLPMWYLARSFLVTSPITCRGERERGREHQNDWCCSYLQRSLRKETTWNVCFRAANWYYFSVFQIISKTHWQTLASYMKKMEGNIDRCVQNLKKV